MAITLTPAILRTRFSEFGSLSDGDIQPWIDQSLLRVNETQWSSKATEGATMLAAHLVATFGDEGSVDGGGSGPVQSEREGGVAVTYAVAQHLQDAGEVASTKYGKNYLSILREIFVTRCV